MKSDWFKSLGAAPSDKERETLTSDIHRSEDVLLVLHDILAGKIKHTVPASYYNEPNFAYRLADRNGYNRALEEVCRLIDINKSKEQPL